jgi:hypothetical protein
LIKQNLLSTLDVDNDIVVVDGGDDENSPKWLPDGVAWCCISIMEGKHLHVQEKIDPYCGLTFTHVDGALPFIQMP